VSSLDRRQEFELGCDENVIVPGSSFRNVFIVDSRADWSSVVPNFEPALDLILTYDFGLLRDVLALGGVAYYVDHLCSQSVMQENNFLMYRFFHDWHLDEEGKDIFRHNGVDFGFSFRILIWNDFTFYVRSRMCLEQLRGFSYQKLLVCTNNDVIESVLQDMALTWSRLATGGRSSLDGYFFPIHRWMNERVHVRRIRHRVRDAVITVQGILMSAWDSVAGCFRQRDRVFVQEYHPTRKLMQCLSKTPGVQVLQGHFSASRGALKFLRERPIPVYGNVGRYRGTASSLICSYRKKRTARLVLTNGVDVTDAVSRAIETRISSSLPETLRALDCVIRYLDRHPIRLEVLIANLGQVAMLVDCVAKARGVPSYLIINGLLCSAFLDEGKYADVINSYSESVRDHYFRGMKNVICLGDPRMDDYAMVPRRSINRENPVITIGASGFSNTDLNSYLAVEFEFLNDVLEAILRLRSRGACVRVVLKVRANGYKELYRRFCDEYFGGVVDTILDQVPMRAVLDETDFYVSIYSQTLFEASCLGIPCVYHKNDRQILDAPFDGRSELVTTHSADELEVAISDFMRGDDRYDAFLDRGTMERYVGPLDGENLKRNLKFIEGLLHGDRKEHLA